MKYNAHNYNPIFDNKKKENAPDYERILTLIL